MRPGGQIDNYPLPHIIQIFFVFQNFLYICTMFTPYILSSPVVSDIELDPTLIPQGDLTTYASQETPDIDTPELLQVLEHIKETKQPTTVETKKTPASTAKESTPASSSNVQLTKSNFISEMTKEYSRVLSSMGLDPKFAKYLAVQDAHESRYGTSSLAKKANNFGGIRFVQRSDETANEGTNFIYSGDWTYDSHGNKKSGKYKFRKFNSLEDYIKSKIAIVGNKNYNVFAYSPEEYFNRLQSAPKHYAEDKDYVKNLNLLLGSVNVAKFGTKVQELRNILTK